MENELAFVKDKWENCISSDGMIYSINSLDTDNHNFFIKTNDNIEVELSSFSIFLKVKRVSKLGPVIQVSNCNYYLTENECKSTNDGNHSYLVKQNSSLKIRFTMQSCQFGGSDFNFDELEEITINTRSYNIDEQKANIEISRKILKL